MVTAAILPGLQVYGIFIVTSALVGLLLIDILVSVTGRMEKATQPGTPTETVCPIGFGVPEGCFAALLAAIHVAIRAHRILHIAPTSHGCTAGARVSQHSYTPGPATGRGSR